MSDLNIMGEDSKLNESSNQKRQKPDPIQAAIDYGIDINALIDNLKRTPEERIRRHQIALNTANQLRKANTSN